MGHEKMTREQLQQELKDLRRRINELEALEQQRTQAQREAHELNQFLGGIIEDANVWFNVLDEHSRVKIWNRAAEEISGYTMEEVVAQSDIWPLFYPDDDYRALITEKATSILQNETVEDFETTIRRKDGSERIISWHSWAMVDEKGAAFGSAAVGRDVTERRRAEEGLRESKERLSLLMDQSPFSIQIFDPQGYCVRVNRAWEKMWGMEWSEFAQSNFNILEDEQSRELGIAAIFDRAVAGETVFIPPTEYVSPRNTCWVQSNIYPTMDKTGQVLNVVVVQEDITERVQAEEEKKDLKAQLFQAQKMEAIGRLAGGVAHDFNNILCAITGNATLAMYDLENGYPVSTRLEEISTAADRAADLTRQLLSFSRKQIIAPRSVDLSRLVENLHGMLVRLIGEDITLKMVSGDRLAKVYVDPSQIEQIVLNLVVNARDAMPKGGDLTIETANVLLDEEYCTRHLDATLGPNVMIAVRDTGSGMSPEVLEKIFEPFFTTKEQGHGTGLGLATVFGIVEQNKGHITVSSEHGNGSSFKVYFSQTPEEAEEETHRTMAAKPAGGHETVLLVEDEEIVRDMATILLESLGYTVIAVDPVDEVTVLLERYDGSVDLLLTDVIMPNTNGRELAKKVTGVRPDIKILYTSGYPRDVIAHHGVLEDGIHFLPKPYSRETIAAAVRKALED